MPLRLDRMVFYHPYRMAEVSTTVVSRYHPYLCAYSSHTRFLCRLPLDHGIFGPTYLKYNTDVVEITEVHIRLELALYEAEYCVGYRDTNRRVRQRSTLVIDLAILVRGRMRRVNPTLAL